MMLTNDPAGSVPPSNPPARRADPRARRQFVWITVGAIAAYVGIRQLPTGTDLGHGDFRVQGGDAIEFCDPLNPQFIPVVAVRSPVEMKLQSKAAVKAGAPVSLVARLKTSTEKPIGPVDLLVTHTRKLHLLIFDPTLRDYQHVHPVPGDDAGEWRFSFTPKAEGRYRVFADFTPIATGRGLYAHADLNVGPAEAVVARQDMEPASFGADRKAIFRRGDQAFELRLESDSAMARTPLDFEFSAFGADDRPTLLEPVMDAYAHLVAIDRDRSGFAHLHPVLPTSAAPTAPQVPSRLEFKVTIPAPGEYVIWAQVRIAGEDRYAPFALTVR